MPCGSHRRGDSSSLGFCCLSELLRAAGALPPVPGPTAPPLPCSTSTTIQHNRSATMLRSMDDKSLTHHEKAVRTRCHMVSRTQPRKDWSRDDTQARCMQEIWEKSTQSQQVVNRGSEHVQRQHKSKKTEMVGWHDDRSAEVRLGARGIEH